MNQTSMTARLEKVALRTAWDGESSNFTPWLARPNNLALLAGQCYREYYLPQSRRLVGIEPLPLCPMIHLTGKITPDAALH